MLKVIGKAYYQVEYNDKIYRKIRYTLELDQDELDRKKLTVTGGVMTQTVELPHRDDTDRPDLGDLVVVSYGVYAGKAKANGIFVIP